MSNTVKTDLKMFAVANSRELLNSAALIIYQKRMKFRAKVMTFTSDAKNAQEWYAFECKKEPVLSYECEGIFWERAFPSDFFPSWKDVLKECGELLGNNGIVFCVFCTHYPNGEDNAVAYYSCPEGVGRQASGMVKAAWGRKFEKGISSPVYKIGNQLIPYELYHSEVPRQVYYPRGADSSYDLMLEKKKEKMAAARGKKAPGKQPAEPEKRKGYYEVAGAEAEKIPFGINDLREYIRRGVSEAGQKPARIPAEYTDLDIHPDAEEPVKIQGKHFTLAAAGELYDDLKRMIEAGGGVLHKDIVQKTDYLVLCFGVETFDEEKTRRDIAYMVWKAKADSGKKSKIRIVTDSQVLAALQPGEA